MAVEDKACIFTPSLIEVRHLSLFQSLNVQHRHLVYWLVHVFTIASCDVKLAPLIRSQSEWCLKSVYVSQMIDLWLITAQIVDSFDVNLIVPRLWYKLNDTLPYLVDEWVFQAKAFGKIHHRNYSLLRLKPHKFSSPLVRSIVAEVAIPIGTKGIDDRSILGKRLLDPHYKHLKLQ